jgi:hypothetical protein
MFTNIKNTSNLKLWTEVGSYCNCDICQKVLFRDRIKEWMAGSSNPVPSDRFSPDLGESLSSSQEVSATSICSSRLFTDSWFIISAVYRWCFNFIRRVRNFGCLVVWVSYTVQATWWDVTPSFPHPFWPYSMMGSIYGCSNISRRLYFIPNFWNLLLLW